MKCYIVQLYLWYLLQSFLYSYSLGEDNSLVATTRLGSLRGQLQPVIDGHSVRQFLGIPYAQPPVGPLRFARPKPAQPWDGVKDAVEFGPICPQSDLKEVLLEDNVDKGNEAPKIPQGEDCLSLNVYTPSGVAHDEKLTVMVWIHGGGFSFGAGRAYNPSVLVALHNVVVVTINYRLGVLGFFNIPGTDVKGNFGMHDQVEALKWVQHNIAAFGGNPDQVTIFGESAGGMSVSSHLFSPLSKGLFHRVIAQSGSCVGPFACVKVTNTDTLEIFSKVLKCDGIDGKLTECLREKSVEDIVDAQLKATWPLVTAGNFVGTIIIDGEFLPDDPESLLKKGKVNKADIITGVTGNEGGFWMLRHLKTTFNAEVFKTAVKLDLLMLAMYTKLVEDSVVFEYFPYDDLNNSDKIRQSAMDVTSDNVFLAPAVVEARLFSKAGNRVYMYVFDHSPHQPRFPEWFGAYHVLDIPFVFGWPLSKDGAVGPLGFLLPGNYSALEQGLSKYMMEMWAGFAKYGDPNGAGAVPVKWPAYNSAGHAHLSISTDPKVKYSLRERKVAFWDEFIPKLTGIKDETAPSNDEQQTSKEEL